MKHLKLISKLMTNFSINGNQWHKCYIQSCNILSMQEDCWICQSIDHVIVSDTLKILTFHKPLVNGHLVIAPVEHSENWQGLSKESSSSLMSKIGEIERIMMEYLECEKIYIMSIGDVDKHVHFHVVPKMAESTGMGKFIFGEEGWVSNTIQSDSENESKSLGLLTTIMMEMG